MVDPFHLRASYGLYYAVGTAGVSVIYQDIENARNRGRKPFGCLNVK